MLQFRRVTLVSVREMPEFLQEFKYVFALTLKSSFVFVFCCYFCLNNTTTVSFFFQELASLLKSLLKESARKVETTKNRASVLVSVFTTVTQSVEGVVQWLKGRRFESWPRMPPCWSALGHDTKPYIASSGPGHSLVSECVHEWVREKPLHDALLDSTKKKSAVYSLLDR